LNGDLRLTVASPLRAILGFIKQSVHPSLHELRSSFQDGRWSLQCRQLVRDGDPPRAPAGQRRCERHPTCKIRARSDIIRGGPKL